MTGDIQVVEDATVDSEERSKAPPARMWILIAFVVGLAFGAVFFGPTVNPPPEPEDPGPQTPLTPGIPLGAVGVSTALPGFPDAIVAIAEDRAFATDYVLWPQARGPSTIPLPVDAGRPVRIDASGVWLAMTQLVPDATGDLLSVGRATGVNPTMSGVASIAWHDSAYGALGFTHFAEGRWGLWRSPAFFNPQLVADLGPGPEPSLLAWGDWGWAIGRSGSEGVELLAPDGSASTNFDGLLGSGPGVAVARIDRRVVLVTADGEERALQMPNDQLGSPVAAAVSPDGGSVAVLTPLQVTVVRRDGAEVMTWDSLGAPRAPLVWSSDSRFVLVPLTPRGVAALDAETGSVTTVLDEVAIRWLGIIPLSTSS